MCSSHCGGGLRPPPPPLLSPEFSALHFPFSSHRSGALARSYPFCFFFFRLFFLHVVFFYFLFPSPFVVPALHDPDFTHSSIKGWGGSFLRACVCVCVSFGSLKCEDFDPFLSSVCVQTPLSGRRVSVQSLQVRSGLIRHIQI